MYLKELHLNNFRSFDDLVVPLQKDLTVLVGENNGGKSNLIDAIRLVTSPLGGRRDIYCEQSDIRSSQSSFEVSATFTELSPPQQGSFLSAALDAAIDPIRFGLTYAPVPGQTLPRPKLWAGAAKAFPEPGCHDLIRHVYLPPLRDAKRALASGNPGRIYALLSHFLNPGQKQEDVAKNLARGPNDPILGRVDTAVDAGLSALTMGVRRQSAALGFSNDEKLIDIARDLRFKMADHGIEPEDLRYSGHGYANLLYIATIAVELERMDDADLTIFLVEEPEAHLHPQLQAAVLGYLEERAELSRQPKTTPTAPAGNLQVVVATHSPNLSAWVESKNVVVLKSVVPTPKDTLAIEGANGPVIDAMDVPVLRRPVTKCLPLAALNLDLEDQRKVDRYLDVTKSAVLFGGRIILVEGIAEALLLPVIAKHITFEHNKESLRLFRSAVFVPIDGVDFEPYAKLLLATFDGVRIADRLVVITDGDRTSANAGGASPGARRKAKLDAIGKHNEAEAVLDVLVSSYSLETELVIAGNDALLRKAYLELHPDSGANWDLAVSKSGDEQAAAVKALFGNTRKGDFAQILAKAIAENQAFYVPTYITDAIKALIK